MNINVLGPDVNESFYKFTVNDNNAIRFGMGAVKGVGESAVSAIIESRKESKYFQKHQKIVVLSHKKCSY